MPPLQPAPVDQTLQLLGQAQVAWAELDPVWYLLTYPSVRDQLHDTAPEAVLRYYLETGQALGHSPNRFFDEAWYRRAYSNVATALTRGHASGFDHYCRGGFRNHAPHWLFDEQHYRRRNTDLTEEALADASMANGYDHYLRHGSQEKRIGHPLFDPTFYLTQLPLAEASAADTAGPFHHYLRHIEAQEGEVPSSIFFDPAWYLAQYPEVADGVAAGLWRCALHHYLANDTQIKFDPLPEFSESYYLSRYSDIAAAIKKGELRSGYRHFLAHGARELRSPASNIDLRYYADHEAVRSELRDGKIPDAFTHYLAVGKAQHLPTMPPPEERVSEGQGKTLFRRKAKALLPLFARRPLDFTCASTPTISVVVVLHNQFALTMQVLGSLRSSYTGAIELVLVDAGSTDETRFLEQYVHGAKIVRFDNVGYLRGCNAGMMLATAPAVLLLNNDVELAPGALAAALDRLNSDVRIGAVGGKVIRAHGLLQEAGNIIWADGSTTGYLRGESPLAPEANFVRDVDFCSGAFLLLRRSLIEMLGGFDEAFEPAYYEDTDLCLRISAQNMRVVYDPAVVVYHLEYGSSESAMASETAIGRSQETFVRKHQPLLSCRLVQDRNNAIQAREAGPRRVRVLFIEDQVPLRRIGSGFVRSNDILKAMAELGYRVTVFPIQPSEFPVETIFAEIPDTIEVMYNRTLVDLPGFLAARSHYYDLIWIARTHNLDKLLELVEPTLCSAERRPRLILDTEAVVSLRRALQVSLSGPGSAVDEEKALQKEFQNAGCCEQIVAVSRSEADILRRLGFPHVNVIGHVRALDPTPRPFEDRRGMLWLGAIHEVDSPNYDSLVWFIDEVLPRVEELLKWETSLTVAGYLGGAVSLNRFRDHSRVMLVGPVADTRQLYDKHRVFIAPTRFAAGIPYKVHEAASFGLPVVATDLLKDQLGWENNSEILVGSRTDPASFSQAVVRLYRDKSLWARIRAGALARLATENSADEYLENINAILGGSQAVVTQFGLPASTTLAKCG